MEYRSPWHLHQFETVQQLADDVYSHAVMCTACIALFLIVQFVFVHAAALEVELVGFIVQWCSVYLLLS